MNSHHTYIPWFEEKHEQGDDIKEVAELSKTLRFCLKCKNFTHFTCKSKNELWMNFACKNCGTQVKIPCKKNRAAKKWDKQKWH